MNLLFAVQTLAMGALRLAAGAGAPVLELDVVALGAACIVVMAILFDRVPGGCLQIARSLRFERDERRENSALQRDRFRIETLLREIAATYAGAPPGEPLH